MKKLNVALVGLGFGLEFVAIYCKHPDIDKVYVVDKNEKLLNIAKERYSRAYSRSSPAKSPFTARSTKPPTRAGRA